MSKKKRLIRSRSSKPLKLDLGQDEVYVFTPKGRVIALIEGATTIDFAYAVHTEVGHHCVGAKVNGRLVPLETVLHSADVVEIVTSKNDSSGPSRDWLNIAVSSRAKSKIRQWFQRERRETPLRGVAKAYEGASSRGLANRDITLLECLGRGDYVDEFGRP